jgi:PAS domain S-box-containing protein
MLILRDLSVSILGTISKAVSSKDEILAKMALEQLLITENLKAIYIFDSELDVSFLTGYKEDNKITISEYMPVKYKLFKYLTFDLSYENKKIGYLRVYYNNEKIVNDIAKLKNKDLNDFYTQSKRIDEEVSNLLFYQFIGYFGGGLLIVLIISYLLIELVNKPLLKLKKGLKSFFDYLEDPKKSVSFIDIDTSDEFGQMSKDINQSVQVSMKMHKNIATLMDIMDKHVITSKTDNSGVITYASEAFCKNSGYSKEELIGSSHSIIRDSNMPNEIFGHLWDTISSGQTWQGEIRNKRKDGSYYWVDTIITPTLSQDNKISEYTSIRYDITAQKEIDKLNLDLEMKVESRTADLVEAKKEIEATHKHTKESIQYAALIQSALIPNSQLFRDYFKDHFVIWHPKDTVGGDIYLFEELRNKDECLLMVIDCTGHGVPGAFVTMLVKAVEREIIAKIRNDDSLDVSPAWIMGYFNRTLKKLLQQENKDSISNVGWDGGIIYYNKKDQILKFAGAETPLFYIDENKEFKTIKGNRYSVGYKKCDANYEYKETVLDVKEGMKFYCTTDGYLDQNGGSKDFPFGKKRFGNIIKQYHEESMADQQTVFIYDMMDYEAMVPNNERNDDMTFIAFEV